MSLLTRTLTAAVLVACQSRGEPPPVSIADASAAPANIDPPEVGLAPLMPDGGWFQTFTDDAGVPTYVAVPTGATTPRPIIVGLHGAQDRPDWACSEWFGAAGGRAFVVCPRGSRSGAERTEERGARGASAPRTESSPPPGAWAWSSVDQIAKKSEEALAIARAHFGPWIAEGRALYGGWSQAATLGALVLAKRPDLFDAGVFVELGHTPLDPRGVAASVRASRVRGVAIVCATASCETWCDRAKPAMTGFPFECETAGHRGHTFDGVVAQHVWNAITFVENGDPRWAAP